MLGFGSGLSACWITGVAHRRRWRDTAALIVLAAAAASLPAPATLAQSTKPAAPQSAPAIERRVDRFLALLDARRKELGVVGAGLVVADRERIVRAAGLGVRSLGSPAPVTADTAFALGSVTKQFTAMAMALAVTEGKMAFEDHPRRYLPSFHLKDRDADAKVTFVDLLAHRTGLGRSDIWLLAPFTQAEMFELAYRSEPAAKLRERFIYNNTMYAIVGAAAASTYHVTYERFLRERFLSPLGMRSSTLTLAAFTAGENRALGYGDGATGATRAVNLADLAAIAPAGALNSTARDMGAWLRFLNARGQLPGAPRIAPAVFARLFERQQPIDSHVSYGFGFFLETRAGVLVASHGGNVPGYTAEVVYLPERGLSFALLTNQSNSQLGSIALELFWETVVLPELPAATAPETEKKAEPTPPTSSKPIAPDRLAGRYFSTVGSVFDIVKDDDGILAVFAGQPPYRLRATAVNVYSLSGMIGFSLGFAESTTLPGRVAVFLRQPPSHPGGNIVYLKIDDAWLARARAAYTGAEKALIGRYQNGDRSVMMEIAPYKGGAALIVTGQVPWPLVSVGADLFGLKGLPDTYRLRIRRSAENIITGFTLRQPNLHLEMSAAGAAVLGSAEQARSILERAVEAAGGEALDRITSKAAFGRAEAPQHGLDGPAEDQFSAGRRAERVELNAFGKVVVKVRAVTDGKKSAISIKDGTPSEATGKELAAARIYAVPHPLYRWKQRFATVATAGETVVNGETAHVIELTPPGLASSKLYISAKSYLVLREEIPSYDGDKLQLESIATDYSDHRPVGGVTMPFKAAATVPIIGSVVVRYERISINAPVDAKIFDIR